MTTPPTARQELNSEFWALIAQGYASIHRMDAAIKSNTTVSKRLETTNERFSEWRGEQ